jgi:hypothetical protein
MADADDAIDVDALVLIVVGAHLRAEVNDRPLAHGLRDRIACALAERQSGLKPVICTDVWFLNNQDLLGRPAISVGDPAVNAATAYLSTRLPTAFMVDDLLRIHLDPEFIEPHACLWGVDRQATSSAVAMFVERYLDGFLEEVVG